jgi:hypothetical protein
MNWLVIIAIIAVAGVAIGIGYVWVQNKDAASRYKTWLQDYPTTNGRIVASTHTAVALAWLITLVVLVGWEPSEMQIKILYGVGIGLLIMQGIDVGQFIAKRFSDSGREAVKQGTAVPMSQGAGQDPRILPTVPTQEFPIPPGAPMPLASRVNANDDAAIQAELARGGKMDAPTITPHVPQYVDGKLQPDD